MTEVRIYLSVGLILFLGVLVFLGYLGYRRTTTIADFAIAGSKLGPYTLGLAYSSTTFSAAVIVGYVGWTYSWGLSSLWVFLTMLFSVSMGMILIAKKVRERNITQRSLSLPDWLGDFYGSDFIRVVVAGLTLFLIFYIASQLVAGALIFETLLGLPYVWGVVVTTVLVVAYVFGGGTFADVYTDAFQALFMVFMGIVIFLSGLWAVGNGGGLTGVMQTVSTELAERDPNLVAVMNPDSAAFYSVPAIVGAFIITLTFASLPQTFNKLLALEDPRDMGKMILVYVVASVGFILSVFGGLYAAVTVPGLEQADNAIFAYIEFAFPPFMVALLGITILAAIMSTTDGLFIVISTAIANDIYRKFLAPRNVSRTPSRDVDRMSLLIGRVITILVGVVAAVMALSPPEYIGATFWIGVSGLASGTLAPILIGLFLPRFASKVAAKVSMIVGISSYLFMLYFSIEASPMARGAWAICIGVVVMLLVGLKYPSTRSDLEQVNEPAQLEQLESSDGQRSGQKSI